MNQDYTNVHCNEVEEWFNEYQDHLNVDKSHLELNDEAQFLQPFVDIERSCSSIDQTMLEIESTLRKTLKNANKVASCTSNSQFCATASFISSSIISASNIKQNSGEGFFSRIISIAHTFSNWFFGFFEL